jgi:hypothetical protein
MLDLRIPFNEATPSMFLQNSYKGFLMSSFDDASNRYFHDSICCTYVRKDGAMPTTHGEVALKRYARKEGCDLNDLELVAVYPMADGKYAGFFCPSDYYCNAMLGLEMAQEDFRNRIKKPGFYENFFKSLVAWFDDKAAMDYTIALNRVKDTMAFWGVPSSAWNSIGGHAWLECFNKYYSKRFYSGKQMRLRMEEYNRFGF